MLPNTHARTEAKDGSFLGFYLEATYTEVALSKSFAYTVQDGREVHVVFVPKGNQTKLDISFDGEDENPVEFQKQGWQAILNNFKQYAEAK